MPTIAILPGFVADQIAAGEVVERPASVVKELVENAIDASATAIDITIQDGGRTLIAVSDNGIGMDREDALLALERHGTSKIRTASDLVGVETFGFRGEALPAISSVSELDVATSQRDGDGVLIRTAAGKVVEVGEVPRRRGTTVTVSRLFYNVPARQKFLKGARSEWRGITEMLSGISLARRDVRFTVTHDGKPVLNLPPATTYAARVAGLWGSQYAESLVAVEDLTGAIHTSGVVERPADAGTATRRVFLTINGRTVRDNGLVRAAESAYRNTIPAGVRPSIFLDVVVPGDLVDVNVHPAKAEVRFRDRWQVERAVENAVRRALGTWDSSASLAPRHFQPAWSPASAGEPVGVEVLAEPSRELEMAGSNAAARAAEPATTRTPVEEQEPVFVPPLFQLHRTYVAFEHEGSGLVLIDQHSAHERILFEQFARSMESGGAGSQRLLFPITLSVGAAEADALEENRAELEAVGFEIESFGGNSLIVHAAPMPHPRFDAARCLRDTLAAMTGDRAGGSLQTHERLLATMACKAAVKAGESLGGDEMRSLFIALRRTTLPAHDVHGRSTIVRIPWEELERRFGRR